MKFNVNKTEKKPLFDQKLQHQTVALNPDKIDMMRGSKSIKEWNNNREIVKDSFNTLILTKPSNLIYRIMLMGYIDGILFHSLNNRRKIT